VPAVILDDADLHAHFLSSEVREDLRWLGTRLTREAVPAWQFNVATLMEHLLLAGQPAQPDPAETVRAVYQKCPPNLAERLLEAMTIYRSVGWSSLPPLLPLAHHLLRAEVHLYVDLDGGKPYRDHLAHQTRVASLAHLLLRTEEDSPKLRGTGNGTWVELLPPEMRWEAIRERWHRTPEFQLIHAYALSRGLRLPPPRAGAAGRRREDDVWSRLVGAAALLAGLVHDIGYVQKSLGAVSERVATTFRSLVFPAAHAVDGPHIAGLPLGRLYEKTISASKQGMRLAPLGEFLSRTYRDLHSVTGALWLATLPQRLEEMLARREHEGAVQPRGPVGDGRGQGPGTPGGGAMREGWFDLTLQLAAMMAYSHDLACASDKKRELLGMRGSAGHEVIHFDDYPLCTLFSLADVIQEFGRPVRAIAPRRAGAGLAAQGAAFVVPIAGLRLEKTQRTAKQQHPEVGALWNLPAWRPQGWPDPEKERLYLSYVTRMGGKAQETGDTAGEKSPEERRKEEVVALRRASPWNEAYVGSGQERWFRAAGLDGLLRLDGEAGAAGRVKGRAAALGEVLGHKKPHGGPATATAAEQMLDAMGKALGLAAAPGRATEPSAIVRELKRELGSEGKLLPRFAPLARLEDGDARLDLWPPALRNT